MAWVVRNERAPEAGDANEFGCVLAWHRLNGCMVMNWHEARQNIYVTHWMPVPEAPGASE